MHRVTALLAYNTAFYLTDRHYAQVQIRAPLLLDPTRDLGVALPFPQRRQNIGVDEEH